MTLRRRPLTIKAANRLVAQWHSHSRPVHGALWALGAAAGDQLVGAAIVGRPVAAELDDGSTCEVLRVATDGYPNACSFLYGNAARAALFLGYDQVVTYTLDREDAACLRAAGFRPVAIVAGGRTWASATKARYDHNLFGEPQRPTDNKVRWAR